MSDPDETRPTAGPKSEVSARRAAFRGAAIACFLLILIAAAQGRFDGWLLLGAALALVLSVFVAGRARGLGSGRQRSPRGSLRAGHAEALLAHIPDPVILVDQRAVVVEANEAAHNLLPALKTGHPLSFALRSPDVLDGIERVLSSQAPLRVEYGERVPTERVFEVHIGPLKHNASAADMQSGVVLFFRDLTSARRLEAMRADFVANASHELRTPLASLLGFIETLQGPAREDPKARERFLEIMRVQAQRMKRLIDDLLSLSRIEMRAHVPPTEPVDLTALAAHMIETLSPLAKERGVDIESKFPDLPAHVLGDRDELLRVLENLIENAVKYGESGGKVEIELGRTGVSHGQQGPFLTVSVKDYGPGIAPEHLPRLTERFYRVDVAQSREKGGTGLGLAIVKHIVNRHRGHLDVESQPGQGAQFTVTLPEAGASGRV
ncbi:ATP-binding protein [Microvirga roseola]|uniref:ATP-binding protein n=1 Tax=Microvirga roseola TaxID=2883126 RepID=UPI001E55C08F|nr:ATP-binding protein [Microvirga roseola]